jgi:broad specificity phosphatase PhoE
MRKEVFFIRHGQTELNRHGIVQGSGVDAPLNEEGHRQAALFYRHYADYPFEKVITSTLQRTVQTIEPFLVQRQLPHCALPEINEISWGDHEGRRSEPWMIEAYNRMIAAWAEGDLHASLRNGESAAQLIARVDRFIDMLIDMPEQNLLVCTHGRTLRCMITRLKQLPPVAMEQVHHANTGVFHAAWAGSQITFHMENDLSHLNAG